MLRTAYIYLRSGRQCKYPSFEEFKLNFMCPLHGIFIINEKCFLESAFNIRNACFNVKIKRESNIQKCNSRSDRNYILKNVYGKN